MKDCIAQVVGDLEFLNENVKEAIGLLKKAGIRHIVTLIEGQPMELQYGANYFHNMEEVKGFIKNYRFYREQSHRVPASQSFGALFT